MLRNNCVFEGASTNLQLALQAFKEELHLWQLSGAKRLTTLMEVVQTSPLCGILWSGPKSVDV
jgi:hypothetical protein